MWRRLGAPMAYDAIIVGSGHNGLAAPSIWQQGWKVGVFERNTEAGGAVRRAK